MPDNTLEIREERGKAVYAIAGVLALQTVGRFRQIIDTAEERTLRMDLSAVTRVDLSGLSWLMQLDQKLRQRGGKLKIIACSPIVRHALHLLRPATMHLSQRRSTRHSSVRKRFLSCQT